MLFAQLTELEAAQQAAEIAKAVAKENYTFAGLLALVIGGLFVLAVLAVWKIGPLVAASFQGYLDHQNKMVESRIAMADAATKKAEAAARKAEEQNKLDADRWAKQLDAERVFRDTTLTKLTTTVETGMKAASEVQQTTAETVTKAAEAVNKAVDSLKEELRKHKA